MIIVLSSLRHKTVTSIWAISSWIYRSSLWMQF